MMNRKTLISDASSAEMKDPLPGLANEFRILIQNYQLYQGARIIKPGCKVQQFYLYTEDLYLNLHLSPHLLLSIAQNNFFSVR